MTSSGPSDFISSKAVAKAAMDGYGLRSASGPSDLNGASYAMDDGATGLGVLKLDAGEWQRRLLATIDFILGFEIIGVRYLLVVKTVRGTGERYGGGTTFPKCSSHATEVVAARELSGTASELASWVVEQLS